MQQFKKKNDLMNDDELRRWVVADAQVSVRLVRQVKRGHLFVCACVCSDGASKRAETSRRLGESMRCIAARAFSDLAG